MRRGAARVGAEQPGVAAGLDGPTGGDEAFIAAGRERLRGVRVELPEVENAVRAHPAVRDVAVVDRDDPSCGKSLCAYVVLEAGRYPAELRPFLLERLPEALVPTWYVAMDALPRTITGKVDRRTLPPPAELRPDREVVGPRTPAEEVLAGQGTVALEFQADAPGLTHVLVATGGGGLIGGMAAWYAGSGVRVVSVEPEGCPTLATALREGRPVPAPVGGLAADSLGARQVGALMFAVAKDHVAEAVLVVLVEVACPI